MIASCNLKGVHGLAPCEHKSPSIIDNKTLSLSGDLPPEFLRACGLSDVDIELARLANPNLSREEIAEIAYRVVELRTTQPIQISPTFISYNHEDGPFVDKIEMALNNNGIRFWRDIHHATAGKLDKIVDRAMRLNPTVLLVLSEHSVNSEDEATKARELEKKLNRDVLCPVALDDSWKGCDWPDKLKAQIKKYHILDFSNWQDDDFFASQFNKLIEGLHIFYRDEKLDK
jgi:hypothetical protein